MAVMLEMNEEINKFVLYFLDILFSMIGEEVVNFSKKKLVCKPEEVNKNDKMDS